MKKVKCMFAITAFAATISMLSCSVTASENESQESPKSGTEGTETSDSDSIVESSDGSENSQNSASKDTGSTNGGNASSSQKENYVTDWTLLEYAGDGAGGGTYTNKYKFYEPTNTAKLVNLQKPGFAEEAGLYVTFPSAIQNCSLQGYAKEGAGIILYISNFTAGENKFTVTDATTTYTCYVFYDENGATKGSNGSGSSSSGSAGNSQDGASNNVDDGTYENGYGAGKVSEEKSSPAVSAISTATNDVSLIKNLNSWSKLIFQFANSTGDVWSDDEIYLYALCQVASTTPASANPDNVPVGGYCYITKDGKLHAIGTTSSSVWEIKFSEIKDSGIQMPYMQSGRIFYSYGQSLTMKGNGTNQGYASPSLANPGDPNYNKYYDWLEFSVATNGFWVNTTQVDQLGFPVLINVYGKTEGEGADTIQTTGLSKTRDSIWQSFKDYCPEEFDQLAGTYRIVAPGKKGFDDRTGDIYGNYFDDYVDYVWNYYKDHTGTVTHPKGVFTITGDGENLYFKCTQTKDDNQMGKVGNTYTIKGKPSTSMVLEGYGVLASPHADGLDGNTIGMELALEAWVCAAFNRGVAHLDPDTYWNNSAYYYRKDLYGSESWWACNWYAGFWHKVSESNGLAYGFCYDDVNDQSATTYVFNPENVVVKLGF